MSEQFQQSLGYLAQTGDKRGVGVFAFRDIDEGEIVEISPVVLLKTAFDDLEKALKHRVFNWERLAALPGISAIALGYGSMYNHDNPANMRYGSIFDGRAVKFIAARAIIQDEELTINYNRTGGEPISVKNVWFETCGVELFVSSSSEDSTPSP